MITFENGFDFFFSYYVLRWANAPALTANLSKCSINSRVCKLDMVATAVVRWEKHKKGRKMFSQFLAHTRAFSHKPLNLALNWNDISFRRFWCNACNVRIDFGSLSAPFRRSRNATKKGQTLSFFCFFRWKFSNCHFVFLLLVKWATVQQILIIRLTIWFEH